MVRPLNLKELSQDIGCSRSALTHSTLDVLGVSLREYHLRVRMRRAFDMLRDPSSKVDAVAALCGYAGAEPFGRAFHRVMNLMPSEVRRLTGDEAALVLGRTLVSSCEQSHVEATSAETYRGRRNQSAGKDGAQSVSQHHRRLDGTPHGAPMAV